MKFVAVIPSRYASVRFPAKPLAKILNKEMLAWVIEGAKSAEVFTDIIVATDHAEIASLAKAYKATAVMTDPDLPTGTDRVWQAVKNIDCDWVVNIQGDEPLIAARALQDLVNKCEANPDWSMASLATQLRVEELENPNVVKVIMNQNDQAIYFSRFAIPFSRDKEFNSEVAKKHMGIYAYKKSFLQKFCAQEPTVLEKKESLEQLRALYMGVAIGMQVGEYDTCGVDVPEDITIVESILKERT